jgi:membrane-associated phospholipid phosphatase
MQKKMRFFTLFFLISGVAFLEARRRPPCKATPLIDPYDTELCVLPRLTGKTEMDVRSRKKKTYANVGWALSDAINHAFYNLFYLHLNIFTWDTLKIASTIFPVYVGSRMVDEPLQNWFYNSRFHKNINQMPGWCHDFAKYSIALPIFLLGMDALVAGNNDKRLAGQVMLIGLPFVIWTKMWVKKIEFNASFRPWNEKFSRKKRAYGGFPSGHMAQAFYMAMLYGTRYGANYGIPLGMVAMFLGINFLTCNRHYASQLIAGAGFGTIYAFAASKLVDSRLADTIEMGLAMDEHGAPAFSLAFRW